MNPPLLRRITRSEFRLSRRDPIDAATLANAARIVDDVRARGEAAVRDHAERLDRLPPSEPLVLGRAELDAARDALDPPVRALLERTAERIRDFAARQRACLTDLAATIPGGEVGHTVVPLRVAGCYAPGGRYPLVSSMLMTAVTARTAGVELVLAASPRPSPLMRATAAIAGVDALLVAGGAQAIAALANGVALPARCDVVVGPGNRWVTAAKHLVSTCVRIDMLAGPSELLILADDSADATLLAADLLAQAEHDPDALPMLIATAPAVLDKLERALAEQLAALPTREIAEVALRNGFALVARTIDEAIELANEIAPEHLELHLAHAAVIGSRIRCCGSLFIGAASAEVVGDYGAGPNHTLPTGGAARYAGGLSVFDFLRKQTWMRIDSPSHAQSLFADATTLARLEGLEGHARSAEARDAQQGNASRLIERSMGHVG